MATQPRVPTAQLPPTPLPPAEELPVGQPTPGQQAFLIRFALQLEPAIGQPSGPVRQESLSVSLEEIKSLFPESAEPCDGKDPGKGKQVGSSSLKKTAFLSGLALMAPAVAAIFGHNVLGCLVAVVSLCVWYILVFTVLLLLEDKISPLHLVELWRTVLKGVAALFKSKSDA